MGLVGILEYNFIEVAGYSLNLAKLLLALAVITGAKLLVAFVLHAFLKGFFRRKSIDAGRQYAIQAFVKYFIYTGAILWALQLVGVHLSVVWAGGAALLVGIGLGLQQTFNDLVSGIILLVEGSVEVGDIVSVDGLIGTVKSIGIRTSKVDTRDDITIIIPNSKLVTSNVVNLSHNEHPTRFQIRVGVAYSSDVLLVKSLLLEAAKGHKEVLEQPTPSVHFKDFGSSSLDFDLLFYTNQHLRIEAVKSDVRFRIIALFRENHIEIPFPQQDVWVRSAGEFGGKKENPEGIN